MRQSPESALHKSEPQADASHLSAQVFTDTHDFLKTLRDHYSELSHGHSGVTLEDLKIEASTNKDANVRAAAQIAADPEHFKELRDIYGRYEAEWGYIPHEQISQKDLKFAQDMNDHNTTGYILRDAAADVGAGFTFLGVGGMTALGAGVGGVMGGLMFFCGAATAIGGVGYYGYEAFKERSRANALADRDSQMFRSWLDKQGA